MPTVHPLTKHTNRAKANIEGIVFLGACPAPTDSCQLQAAGRLGLPLASQDSPPHVSPASPTGTLALLWEAQRGGGGWLARNSHFKSKYTDMELECVCTLTHASLHVLQTYTSVVCAHANTPTHMLSILLFSSVPASLCRVVRFTHTTCQEYKRKKGSHCCKSQVQCSTLSSVPEVWFT